HARLGRGRHARDRPRDSGGADRRLRLRTRRAARAIEGTDGALSALPAAVRGSKYLTAPLMRVWVDCTAAAHPLVLRPIIERLRGEGHDVSVTARRYGQTIGILERLGIEHEVIGHHADGGSGAKAAAVASRSAALARWARPR